LRADDSHRASHGPGASHPAANAGPGVSKLLGRRAARHLRLPAVASGDRESSARATATRELETVGELDEQRVGAAPVRNPRAAPACRTWPRRLEPRPLER